MMSLRWLSVVIRIFDVVVVPRCNLDILSEQMVLCVLARVTANVEAENKNAKLAHAYVI
jgi:hypothetical protein